MGLSDYATLIRPTGLDRHRRRSCASLGEKASECAASSRHGLERLPLPAWTSQEAPAFVLHETLFDRFRSPLERANLGHGLPTIRNRDGFSLTHLPDDLRELRLGFVSRICGSHRCNITRQIRLVKYYCSSHDRGPGVRASSPQAAKMAALPGSGRASGPRRGPPDRSREAHATICITRRGGERG